MLVGKTFSIEWMDSFYEEDDWASPAGQVVSGIKTPIYRKIIVTGPQRSGTRFVGMLLADALKDFI